MRIELLRRQLFPLLRSLISGGAVVALALVVGTGVLSAKNPYAEYPARGLAIYKPSLIAADTSARITEYLGYQSYETVTYLITPDGSRLTVPTRTADLLILPYPGRGELQPEAALLIISVAESRFPQYRQLIAPLRAAWVQESKRPRAKIAEEIQQHQENQSIAQKMTALWNSVTKPAHKPVPEPAAAATPVQIGDQTLKPNPAELEKNLKIIKDYYQTLEKVGSGTNQ
jgi:hypothetical protein